MLFNKKKKNLSRLNNAQFNARVIQPLYRKWERLISIIVNRKQIIVKLERAVQFPLDQQGVGPIISRIIITSIISNLDYSLPQSLLTHVSRATKQTLNKLGVFTVSSFHAFICARSPSLLNNLLAGRGATKRRPPLLSRSNSGSSRRSLQISSRDDEKTVKVFVPENQVG